jgi:hypothetical protein
MHTSNKKRDKNHHHGVSFFLSQRLTFYVIDLFRHCVFPLRLRSVVPSSNHPLMLSHRSEILKKHWLTLGLALLAGCQSVAPTAPVASTKSLESPNAAQTWLALSTTAMSITGDIVLTSSQITFQNGETLAIRPIEKDDDLGLVLYQVTSKTNPILLNGNTFCGTTPVDYLTVQTDSRKTYNTESTRTGMNDMSLTVYRYPDVMRIKDLPLRDNTDIHHSLCAIYNYMAAPTAGGAGMRP